MIFVMTPTQYEDLQHLILATAFPATIDLTTISSGILVSLTKWGTSFLRFDVIDEPDNMLRMVLVKKDIAWLHTGYIARVEQTIKQLVHSVGGKVVS